LAFTRQNYSFICGGSAGLYRKLFSPGVNPVSCGRIDEINKILAKLRALNLKSNYNYGMDKNW